MDQRPSNFKISVEDERSDGYMRPRRETLKVERLSRKLTATTVFFFFLAVAIIGVGFFYVQKKIEFLNNAGETGVKGLSQNLEARYADLSQRIVRLEETFKKEVAPIGELSLNFEETTASVRENVKNTETMVNELRASLNELKTLKADKKDFEKLDRLDKVDKLEKAVGELSKTVETLYTDIKALESQTKGWDDKISKQNVRMVESVERAANEVSKIQSEISKQSFNKIDQKMLDLALKKQQEKFQKDLSDVTGKLQDREDQLKALERRIRDLETMPRSPLSPRSSGKPSGSSKPDPIVEQNLE